MVKKGTVSTVSEGVAKVILDGIDKVITTDLSTVYFAFNDYEFEYTGTITINGTLSNATGKFKGNIIGVPTYKPNDRVLIAVTDGWNGVIIGLIKEV